MGAHSETSAGVIWATGLPKSGKSTVALALRQLLRREGTTPLLLDGDVMRRILGAQGFSREERLGLAFVYARLAAEFAAQGHLVICATVSLFREVHAWNRANLPGYFEVWLRAPAHELRTRDGGGLYAAPVSERGPLPGLEIEVDFAETPDLVIGNFGETTAAQAAEAILARFRERQQ